MQYIITEDEVSGLKLWKKIGDFFKKKYGVKVHVDTSRGNKNLCDKIKSLNITKKDKLLIALDDLGKETETIYTQIENYCEALGIEYQFTEYYSIEEAFISYTGWQKRGVNWQNSAKNKDCCNAFKAIQQAINNGIIAYEPSKMDGCLNFINSHLLTQSTKEEILTAVLSEYTKHSMYRVISKEISDCWLSDCCHDKPKIKQSCYYGKLNAAINKSELLKDKFKDLNQNSIFGVEFKKLYIMINTNKSI